MIGSEDSREYRVDAIKRNAEWLQEHDLEENSIEAARRVGLILGDAKAIKRSLGDDDGDSLDDVPDGMQLAFLIGGGSVVLQHLKELQDQDGES